MTRLKSIRYIALIIATIFLVTSSIAHANLNGAQDFVKSVSNQALDLIKNKTLNDKQKEEKLISMFENVVDTKWIGRFALGSSWNSATDEQKKQYLELHHKYLINSYIPKFRQYTNQEIKFKKFYTESKGEYLVETEIVQADAPSINVNYKVRETGSKYQIYDVIAEGVSLITTQRSDFAAILSRGGIDDLIAKLKDKVKS
jgi:phospholipid transport system substrate-binding protein